MRTAALAIAIPMLLITSCGGGGGGGGGSAAAIPSPFDMAQQDDGTFVNFYFEVEYDGPADYQGPQSLAQFEMDAIIPIRIIGLTPDGHEVVVDIDPRFQIEVEDDQSEGCFELRGGHATGYWVEGNGCTPIDPMGPGGRKLVLRAWFYDTPTSPREQLTPQYNSTPLFVFMDDPNCTASSGIVVTPCL